MTRQIQSLAGTWQFATDPDGTFKVESLQLLREIPVPMPWQAAFPDLQHYSGYAWYQRTFEIESAWLNGEVLLKFGAVDYWCEVFINGQKAGEHEGGYTPFTFPIKNLLQAGTNTVTLRVFDPIQRGAGVQRNPSFPLEAERTQPPFGHLDVPHGKQEWYINVGGIWQDVTLTAVPATYIDNVKVIAKLDGSVSVDVRLGGADVTGQTLSYGVHRGREIIHTGTSSTVGQTNSVTLHIEKPVLWSMHHPVLYELEVALGDDIITTRFGFREVTTHNGTIHLNGEPVYLIAALDQDFYLDTIYIPPSADYIRDQFRKAKEMGLNCLRCHIKPPDPIYFDIADEMGLLIWTEIPSWRTFYPKGTLHTDQLTISPALKNRVETTLRDMIERDFNHPSILIWTLVNEDWGTALPLSSADRAWVFSLFDLCKQFDPTRLVVDNSACLTPWGPNIHVKSDLDDWHVYANIPDSAPFFISTIEALNMRALWTYSGHGDTYRTGDEPVLVSEFGNWGLPSIKPFMDGDHEPEWFNLGAWWGGWDGEAGWMKGVLDRFKRYGLQGVFGDFEAFAKATQWHQYFALKYEIEAMRLLPVITGYVITEFTDVYWESNGLLDFERRPKVFHDVLKRFNAEDVIVPQVSRYAYWDDETLTVKPSLSHYSIADWAGITVEISGEGETKSLDAGNVAHASVVNLVSQTLPLQPVQQVERKSYTFRVKHPEHKPTELTSGRSIPLPAAENTLDVLVLPASTRRASYNEQLAVIERPEMPATLIDTLKSGGYNTQADLTNSVKLAVTAAPNPALLQWVRDGGDLLFACQGGSPFFWAHGRGGTYGGNWMSSWNWIRPGIHKRLDHEGMNPLSLPFMRMTPNQVILGAPVENAEYHNDVLAGQVTGWVHHPAVHTLQFQYGQGRVVMTTFDLLPNLNTHPAATAMFHDLVDYLAEGRCQPKLKANR